MSVDWDEEVDWIADLAECWKKVPEMEDRCVEAESAMIEVLNKPFDLRGDGLDSVLVARRHNARMAWAHLEKALDEWRCLWALAERQTLGAD